MTFQRDANQIATEYTTREGRDQPVPGISPVWGDLTLWQTGRWEVDPPQEFKNVSLDLNKPGLIIAYHRDSVAMVISLHPGAVAMFEPRREGE